MSKVLYILIKPACANLIDIMKILVGITGPTS